MSQSSSGSYICMSRRWALQQMSGTREAIDPMEIQGPSPDMPPPQHSFPCIFFMDADFYAIVSSQRYAKICANIGKDMCLHIWHPFVKPEGGFCGKFPYQQLCLHKLSSFNMALAAPPLTIPTLFSYWWWILFTVKGFLSGISVTQ